MSTPAPRHFILRQKPCRASRRTVRARHILHCPIRDSPRHVRGADNKSWLVKRDRLERILVYAAKILRALPIPTHTRTQPILMPAPRVFWWRNNGPLPCRLCPGAPTPSATAHYDVLTLSKLSKQEASLSDVHAQIAELQAQVASLSDVQARLAALERQMRHTAGPSSAFQPSPAQTEGTSSYRDPPSVSEPIRDVASVRTVRAIPRPEESGQSVVHDFENGDMNSTSLLSDVRLYLTGENRLKRRRVSDDPEAWRMAFDMCV